MKLFVKETEILTENGWLPIYKLSKNFAVASVNPQNLEMSFSKPENISRLYHTGKIFHWKSLNFDAIIHPNSEIIFQSEWTFQNKINAAWQTIQAKDAPARFYVPQAVNWNQAEIKTVSFAGEKIATNDFLCFMGAWISEGCTRKSLSDVVISQDKGEYADKIWKVLERLPFNFRRVPQTANRANHIQFKSSDKRLFEALKIYGKSGDKFVPEIIKQMSVGQIELFLLWYGLGDGYQNSERPLVWHYVSKSKRLIDDIQELLLRTKKTGCASNYENCSRIETRVHKQKSGRDYKWYGKIYPQMRKIIDFCDDLISVKMPFGAVLVRYNGRPYVA